MPTLPTAAELDAFLDQPGSMDPPNRTTKMDWPQSRPAPTLARL